MKLAPRQASLWTNIEAYSEYDVLPHFGSSNKASSPVLLQLIRIRVAEKLREEKVLEWRTVMPIKTEELYTLCWYWWKFPRASKVSTQLDNVGTLLNRNWEQVIFTG